MGEYGTCKHCKGDECKFRKDYQINGISYQKCSGMTFKFNQPTIEKLQDYLSLFNVFYPVKLIVLLILRR